MDNISAVLVAVFFAMGLVDGNALLGNTSPPVKEAVYAAVDEYTENRDIADWERAAFQEAMRDFGGTNYYQPLKVATHTAADAQYRFLCRAVTVGAAAPEITMAYVMISAPSGGEASVVTGIFAVK